MVEALALGEMMIPDFVVCQTCKQRLWHNKRYCPLFPDVVPPFHWTGFEAIRVQEHKWENCVCLIHTCYDADKLGIIEERDYVDYP